LDSPLLKILLLTERSEHVNEVFASRDGEYHTIFHELLSQQNKFSEYFRMSPEIFNIPCCGNFYPSCPINTYFQTLKLLIYHYP
jgi:hypothetical protein